MRRCENDHRCEIPVLSCCSLYNSTLLLCKSTCLMMDLYSILHCVACGRWPLMGALVREFRA